MRFTEVSSLLNLPLMISSDDRGSQGIGPAWRGYAPCIRINGDLVPVDAPPEGPDVEYMILSIIRITRKRKLENDMELDFPMQFPDTGSEGM